MSGSKEPSQTEIRINLDRDCQQAGSAVRGRVFVRLGEAQRDLFSRYDQGALIAIRLTADEKVYWAAGSAHDPRADKATKHLVHGDMRRELQTNLLNIQQNLGQFFMQDLASQQYTKEVSFIIPLPDDLPPSFLYAGEMMSLLSVEYKLTAMLVGQTRQNQRQLIIQTARNLFVREMDLPPQLPITVTSQGQITGTMGFFGKGETKIEG